MSRVSPFYEDVPSGPRVLAVVAHPDDEYHFAVTLYRIVRELGGVADQVIITDGAGGHRYSHLAQEIYGICFEKAGARLREVRRAESSAAGQVLGIRQHYFLDQPDTGFTLNPADAIRDWDHQAITESLDQILEGGEYDYVFTLLPGADTHGHHKATALLTLEAVQRLPGRKRPVVLGAEASAGAAQRRFTSLDGYPTTRTAGVVYSISRTQTLPFDASLNYQIIANWVIAAHKSQGLFQMDASRHDVEHFWPFETSRAEVADRLFHHLAASSRRLLSIPA